eukprot:TRINITY_DN949_c1_g3_i1.p1 TRINITY_DN949_c1_g3~~TRINITY_DN949_c1_g3_i1.p1  ORF type:complete len:977 (+),score=318.90 TRINITY_DN949_c1_g3_i1:62-2992(+)
MSKLSEIHAAVLDQDLVRFKKVLTSSTVNQKETGEEQTPLHIACTVGNLEIVQLLIKKKARINEQDKNGWTPLHCACSSNHGSVVAFLLSQPTIDILVKSIDNASPFHYFVRQRPEPSEEEAYATLLRDFLDRAPVGLIGTSKSEYPQHQAALRSNLVALKVLKEYHQLIPHLMTKLNETALHYAAQSTASGSIEVMKFLLESGFNKYMRGQLAGSTPLALAKTNKNNDAIEFLQDKLAGVFNAVRTSNTKSLAMFIQGGDINKRDKNGLSPLLHSLTLESMEPAKMLLKSPIIDIRVKDANEDNVLHYVSCLNKENSELIFGILISDKKMKDSLKEIFNQKNLLGETALHVASVRGNVGALNFLLQHGADPSCLTMLNETPMHYAVMGDRIDAAIALQQTKCDVEMRALASTYDTAGDLAQKIGLKNFSEILPPPLSTATTGKTLTKLHKETLRLEKEREKETQRQEREKEKERERQEKERKKQEERERKDRERQERERQERQERQEDDDMSISGPQGFSQNLHVDKDFQWTGGDISQLFKLEKKIGEGAYGAVFKAMYNGIIPFAIKTVTLGDAAEEMEKEINILRGCQNPAIVSYYGSSPKEGKLWILMEYCEAGSVADIMKIIYGQGQSLTEDQIAALMIDVVKGLIYLHSKNIVHRDLKPGNILMNAKGEAKLADFGVSAQLDGLMKTDTTIGTPLYMSPEAISGEKYGCSTDIWSLGITVIEIAQNKIPLSDVNIAVRAMGMIVNNPPPTLEDQSCRSAELNHFIAQALNKSPQSRITAPQLLTVPFLTSRLTSDTRQIVRNLLEITHPEIVAPLTPMSPPKVDNLSNSTGNSRVISRVPTPSKILGHVRKTSDGGKNISLNSSAEISSNSPQNSPTSSTIQPVIILPPSQNVSPSRPVSGITSPTSIRSAFKSATGSDDTSDVKQLRNRVKELEQRLVDEQEKAFREQKKMQSEIDALRKEVEQLRSKK